MVMVRLKRFLPLALVFLISLATLSPSQAFNAAQKLNQLNIDIKNITILLKSLNLTNPDSFLDTPALAQRYNYSCETHTIVTNDSYILTYHRIPCGKNQGTTCGSRPVAFLHHGLFSDSVYFLTTQEYNALPYILANAGFDVWLGNCRGNKYSRGHLKYNSSDPFSPYWQTGQDDMGEYDLPAAITYILDTTKRTTLTYLGWSMGTTIYFIMCIVRPDICAKVNYMVAYAPILYTNHMTTPVRLAAPVLGDPIVMNLLIEAGQGEFFPSYITQFIQVLGGVGCQPQIQGDLVCAAIFFALMGFDYDQLDREYFSVIVSNAPSSTTTQTMLQYFQQMQYPDSDPPRFQKVDFGPQLPKALNFRNNMEEYKTDSVPQYDISKIVTNKTFFYGLNDWLGDPTDILLTRGLIPNTAYVAVNFSKWNHMDFVWGKDAYKILHPLTLQLFKDANNM